MDTKSRFLEASADEADRYADLHSCKHICMQACNGLSKMYRHVRASSQIETCVRLLTLPVHGRLYQCAVLILVSGDVGKEWVGGRVGGWVGWGGVWSSTVAAGLLLHHTTLMLSRHHLCLMAFASMLGSIGAVS